MPNLIFLPQIHASNSMVDRLLEVETESSLSLDLRLRFESIVESQYNIARYLAEHPQNPVLFENNSPETISTGSEKLLQKTLFSLFPNGDLPKKFETLTFKQKRFLITVNAYKFSLFAGKTLHGYYDHPDNIHLSKKIESITSIKDKEGYKTREKLEQWREYNTIAHANNIATMTGNDTIVVIGEGHLGKGQLFAVANQCFPGITIKVVDFKLKFEKQEEDHPYKRAMEESEMLTKLYRPPLDCRALSESYKFPPRHLLSDKPSISFSANQSNHLTTAICGSILLVGITIFGVFKCCKRKRKSNATPSTAKLKMS